MLLKELLEKNPEDAFIYLERRINNEKFPAEIKENYKFYGNSDNFELPFVLLDLNEITSFEKNPYKKLKESLYQDDKLKFFIHPEMLQVYKDKKILRLLNKDGAISVSPTSSTRTVFTRNLNYNLMIKTDLEKKIGDGIKRLKSQHLAHIKKIGSEFNQNKLPDKFAYMPESFGAVYTFGKEEVGLIAREFNTKPEIKYKKYLLPFFSLFSLDKNAKKDPFLLCQIIENIDRKGCKETDFRIETKCIHKKAILLKRQLKQ